MSKVQTSLPCLVLLKWDLLASGTGMASDHMCKTELEMYRAGSSMHPPTTVQVWQYEGDYTLWDLMQKKEFPYNMEPLLLGGELDLPKGPRRKAVTIQLVLQQVGRTGLG